MSPVRIAVAGLALFALLELPQLVSETTAFTSFAANAIFEHNFHEVVPGRLFRSGEMSSSELRRLAKDHGIRTIIDLRADGFILDESGVLERDAAQAAGLAYYHHPLVGSKVPDPTEIEALIDLFDRVEEPLLVHCSSGTHRSGVVSAVWLLTRTPADFALAKEQLSPRYGFFRVERNLKSYLQGRPTIDNLIWSYGEAFERSRISFREWIREQRNGANRASVNELHR